VNHAHVLLYTVIIFLIKISLFMKKFYEYDRDKQLA